MAHAPHIILSIIALCIALYVVARNEAEFSLPVVILICAGVGLSRWILALLLTPWLAVPAALALLLWAVHKFCYLDWRKTSIVTGIYLLIDITLLFGLRFLNS